MKNSTIFILYSALLIVLTVTCAENNTEKEILERRKRFLIYNEGGLYKLVIGVATPLMLGLKQTIAWAVNVQFQYGVYTSIDHIKKPYPPIVARSKREDPQFSDRSLSYMGIETILNRHGFSGKQCLLRAICENAADPTNHDGNGVFGQMVHIILTPDYNGDDGTVELDFIEAQKAGHFGADCSELYFPLPAVRRSVLFSLIGSGL